MGQSPSRQSKCVVPPDLAATLQRSAGFRAVFTLVASRFALGTRCIDRCGRCCSFLRLQRSLRHLVFSCPRSGVLPVRQILQPVAQRSLQRFRKSAGFPLVGVGRFWPGVLQCCTPISGRYLHYILLSSW